MLQLLYLKLSTVKHDVCHVFICHFRSEGSSQHAAGAAILQVLFSVSFVCCLDLCQSASPVPNTASHHSTDYDMASKISSVKLCLLNDRPWQLWLHLKAKTHYNVPCALGGALNRRDIGNMQTFLSRLQTRGREITCWSALCWSAWKFAGAPVSVQWCT